VRFQHGREEHDQRRWGDRANPLSVGLLVPSRPRTRVQPGPPKRQGSDHGLGKTPARSPRYPACLPRAPMTVMRRTHPAEVFRLAAQERPEGPPSTRHSISSTCAKEQEGSGRRGRCNRAAISARSRTLADFSGDDNGFSSLLASPTSDPSATGQTKFSWRNLPGRVDSAGRSVNA